MQQQKKKGEKTEQKKNVMKMKYNICLQFVLCLLVLFFVFFNFFFQSLFTDVLITNVFRFLYYLHRDHILELDEDRPNLRLSFVNLYVRLHHLSME